jgi:ABC-type multidrug transport system fused ATPase/permease subunit
LARALYHDSDILILDDPLSSVDIKVSKSIFEEAIMKYSKKRTILIATHQTTFMEQSDRILMMKDGRIEYLGTFEDLLKNGVDFKQIKIEKKDNLPEPEKETNLQVQEDEESESGEESENEIELTEISKWKTFTDFIFSIGRVYPLTLIFISLMSSFSPKVVAWVASSWASDSKYQIHSSMHYLSLFTICSLSDAFLSYLNDFFKRIVIWKISDFYHSKLLHGVLKSPIQFFQEKSTGNIMSRYTRDLNVVNSFWFEICSSNESGKISDLLNSILSISSTIIFVSFISPMFLLASIPLMYWIYSIIIRIQPFSNVLDDLYSKIEEPVDSFVNESIEGIETIRSYNLTDQYSKKFFSVQDDCTAVFYMNSIKWDWLYFRVVYFSQFLLFISLFIVAFNDPKPETIGLIISILFETSFDIQSISSQIGKIDQMLLKIERMKQFINLKPEGNEDDHTPSMEWPEYGKIEFQNVKLKYPSSETFSLEGVSFIIQPKQKIGISGRTGRYQMYSI